MKFITSYFHLFLGLFLSMVIALPSLAQLQFIENKGQWNSKVNFKAEVESGAFYMEQNGFTVLLHNTNDLKAMADLIHGRLAPVQLEYEKHRRIATVPKSSTLHSHAYRVRFDGALKNVSIFPDKSLPTFNNYFLGNDPAKWQSNCKIYQAITYRNMYPNIDVRYYTDAGKLKYDIIVRPGGNVNDIALKYDGVDKLEVRNKELVVVTSVGEVKELYPYSYQLQKGIRQTLDCKYSVTGNTVRFKIKDYLPNETIVIDPTLIFASFTGSSTDNWGYTATPGPDGSMFAGGISYGDGYPVSVGAFDKTFNGGLNEDSNGPYDIAIIKFSPDGANRIFATYLGGAGNEQPHSMICDAQGNLIIAGRTSSTDYPKTSPLIGPGGGYDIVVTKLNANGNLLLGSIAIGGTGDDGINVRKKFDTPDGAETTRRNYGDDARSEVILDRNNNIYVASCTKSSNFPVAGSNIQNLFGGGKQDGVILAFNSNLSTRIFSTYFGGNGTDACFVLSINPLTGNVYVAGGTSSTDLPGNKTNVVNTTFQGSDVDGFVTQIAPDGSSIIKTSYMGTSGNDLVYGIQFDKFGFPYITGTTTGNWPIVNAAYSNSGAKQFISKLQPDLSSFVYSTVFGTNSAIPNLSITAFLVDRCQNVYVSGWGGKFNNDRGYPNAGTLGLPITNDAISPKTTDGNDFYFFVLEKNANSQLFGSFYGQKGGFDDHVDGGTSRFDANGIIYQAICANCGGRNDPLVVFPTTAGVWATRNGSPNCNEAAVKIEMNFGGVGASIKATVNGIIDTVGCVPMTVKFSDTLSKGKMYIWDYGDPADPKKDTTYAPNSFSSHVYTTVGIFQAKVISVDSLTCNISDTAITMVRVSNNLIKPDFFGTKNGGCQSLTFQFKNTSTAILPSYTNKTFLWDFGDNTPTQRAGIEDVFHTYAASGTYIVKLLTDDVSFCNAPITVTDTIRLADTVRAGFQTPDKGCLPYLANFKNTTVGGIDFLWNFGDGTTSTEVNPVHLYAASGTYTVTLTATDLSTCNRTDKFTSTISVYNIPVAGFSFSPNPTKPNRPVDFKNLSIGANNYLWIFGDEKTSTLENPTHLFNATGTFKTCLVAFNEAGCSDTTCLDIAIVVLPVLDVPNAFTPDKFGPNGIIKVVGYGIAKMDWKIYNRWGQNVFSSSSQSIGWDGKFNGAGQPMDVYSYTLDVEFSDGKKLRKTGDISLLR